MHQSIPPAPRPPPRATAGHLHALSVPGVGHLQILHYPGGRAFANPGAIPEVLTRTRFPIRIWLHRRFYWKKSRLAHLSTTLKDMNKLKRVVKACSRFYACVAYQARITLRNWSYRCESTFFGHCIKFLFILFEENPFTFIKLFITNNFTVPY